VAAGDAGDVNGAGLELGPGLSPEGAIGLPDALGPGVVDSLGPVVSDSPGITVAPEPPPRNWLPAENDKPTSSRRAISRPARRERRDRPFHQVAMPLMIPLFL
jgi:hypothetical protein